MVEKEQKVLFLPLLNIEARTYDSRANNYDICGTNFMKEICVFTSYEYISHNLLRTWRKRYYKLKEGRING